MLPLDVYDINRIIIIFHSHPMSCVFCVVGDITITRIESYHDKQIQEDIYIYIYIYICIYICIYIYQ